MTSGIRAKPAALDRTRSSQGINLESLRPPSTPELRIETVSSGSTAAPGTPTKVELRVEVPSGEKIENHVRLLIEAQLPVAAADVLMIAGRFDEALQLYLDNGVHHRVGACLRKLGHPGEAIAHLLLTESKGPHYREACREIAGAAVDRAELDPMILEYLEVFSDSGPRSENEVSAFLDLAEIFKARDNQRRAMRCLQGVLRIDPDHSAAQLMQLTWMAEL